MRCFVLTLALIASPMMAQNGQVHAAVPTKVNAVATADRATAEQLRQYFELTHLTEVWHSLASQMINNMKAAAPPYVPEDVWADMERTMGGYDFISELIPIYQKHVTRQDMNAALAFYSSDAGQHLVANQVVTMTEAQDSFRMIGLRLGDQIGQRHASEINAARQKYELNIAAKQGQSPTAGTK